MGCSRVILIHIMVAEMSSMDRNLKNESSITKSFQKFDHIIEKPLQGTNVWHQVFGIHLVLGQGSIGRLEIILQGNLAGKP